MSDCTWAPVPVVTPCSETGCGPVSRGAPRARLAISAKLARSCYSSVKINVWSCLREASVRDPKVWFFRFRVLKFNPDRLKLFSDLVAFDLMLLHLNHTRTTFRKLTSQMSKVAGKPAPENVHKFRTSSRRVEVVVSDLAKSRNGNDKKLLNLLGRLRKKAGRLRDLDVQSGALRSLKIPQEPGRKSQLMRTLAEERARREKKLAKSLDKRTVGEVRKRLKRTTASLEIPKNADPLSRARQKLNDLEVDQGVV